MSLKEVNHQDDDGKTPLMKAAEQGSTNTVLALLDDGADASLEDQVGRTALVFASDEGHADVVETIVRHQGVGLHRMNGAKALRYAAGRGHTQVVEVLLDAGADTDLNVQDRDQGWTPLFFAAAHGRGQVIKVLLGRGANANLRDANGSTALMLAVKKGDIEGVSALLAADADVNVQDNVFGLTALMSAAAYGQEEIVVMLLGAGANRDVRSRQGMSATMMAESNGYPNIVSTLSRL